MSHKQATRPSPPHRETTTGMHPAYLIYSLFYFFPLLFMPDFFALTSEWWLGFIGIYFAFIAIYMGFHYLQQKQKFLPLALLLICSTIGTLYSTAPCALFAYAPYFLLGMRAKRQEWISGILATLAAIGLGAWITDFVWYFWAIALGVLTLNIVGALLAFMQRQAETHYWQQQQIAERERLAQDLHDTTGHHVIAIALKAQLAARLLNSGDYSQAEAQLHQLSQLADEHRQALRQAIQAQSAAGEALTQEGLENLYRRLHDLMVAQGFTVTAQGQPPRIKAEYRNDIAAIWSESMTNVLRHSDPGAVTIRHEHKAQGYYFSLGNPSTAKIEETHEGLGLSHLSARAQKLGGQAQLTQTSGDTAQFELHLPSKVFEQPFNH
jgi:two-component system, NarL family, sensor histidine kinase DesK